MYHVNTNCDHACSTMRTSIHSLCTDPQSRSSIPIAVVYQPKGSRTERKVVESRDHPAMQLEHQSRTLRLLVATVSRLVSIVGNTFRIPSDTYPNSKCLQRFLLKLSAIALHNGFQTAQCSSSYTLNSGMTKGVIQLTKPIESWSCRRRILDAARPSWWSSLSCGRRVWFDPKYQLSVPMPTRNQSRLNRA